MRISNGCPFPCLLELLDSFDRLHTGHEHTIQQQRILPASACKTENGHRLINATDKNSAIAINAHATRGLDIKSRDEFAVWLQNLYSVVFSVAHNEVASAIESDSRWTIEFSMRFAVAAKFPQKISIGIEHLQTSNEQQHPAANGEPECGDCVDQQ